jgi:hypothetical protein
MPIYEKSDYGYWQQKPLHRGWHRNDFITHLMHEATGGPSIAAIGDRVQGQSNWQWPFSLMQLTQTVHNSRFGTTRLQGVQVASTPPTNGQVLVFDSTLNEYVPETPSASTSKAFIGGTIGTTITPSFPENPLYIPVTGGTFGITEADLQLAVPFAGTIRNLFIRIWSFSGTATSYTFTINKNGAATPIVATLTPGPTPPFTISDITHTEAVAQGDLIDIVLQQHGGVASYTIGIAVIGLEIDPT